MIAARNWANSAYLIWTYADTAQALDARAQFGDD
jgi:hypothetical protein